MPQYVHMSLIQRLFLGVLDKLKENTSRESQFIALSVTQ
jgi:hypothetical protein